MRINELKQIAPILKIGAIAEESGIIKNTLYKKMQRGTELTQDESDAIERVLKSYGVKLEKAL